MDFLELLDLDATHKKCHRVRSWYLYEQYKSLEKSQLDAAQKLKNKSYQDRILKQELKERRARRRLCDQFGICQSEVRLENSTPSKTPLSVSTDDLFESFCELHEEPELDDFEDDFCHDGSQTSKNFDTFINIDNKLDDSDRESTNSVIKNVKRDKNLADDIKGELEVVKKNIAENINLQLETVKENIECLEKYINLGDDDKVSEVESFDLFEQCKSDVNTVQSYKKFDPKIEKSFVSTWSKLVTFAYKTMQLNHGHILQPYVSPIKYATSDSDISIESYNHVKRKKSVVYKKRPRTYSNVKHHSQSSTKSCRKLRWLLDREYQSENKWQHRPCDGTRCNGMKLRRASEPWHNVPKLDCSKKSSGKCSSLWPDEFTHYKISEESICKCRCLKGVISPIFQIARYIESILQDIEN